MALPYRMKFGLFLGPFHAASENPTLALERDLELTQWLDTLGFDEVWVGEHHSAGWETIASPEIFIATAAERTRHIKLGTGVISLPYHHPFMVAERMVLLDHLTRGRLLMGVGPGALASDAYMLGIDPTKQRAMMDESLGVILRLFTEEAPLTYESDWFQLREAMLQLRPYQRPHMPISVAAVQSPAGVALAGKHGASVLSMSVPPAGPGSLDLSGLWSVAEESAEEHGKTVSREDWRLVVPVHLAESRKEAIEDARMAAGIFQRDYFEGTIGAKSGFDGPADKIIDANVDAGAWVVGTPDDCIEAIRRFNDRSGGFGGFLVMHNEWAPWEKVLHSYELLARYVMPHFQGSLSSIEASNQWTKEHVEEFQAMSTRAIDRAKQVWAARGQ